MIDRRLQAGPFSSATGVYTAPSPLAVGDALTPDEVVKRLRRSGYTTEPDNPMGWYRELPRAIEIHPGPKSLGGGSPARIEFANGKASRIETLPDHRARSEYQLDPQLIAHFSGDRQKRVIVRFRDIPRALVQAVVSVEDKRFFRHSGFDPIRVIKAAYVDLRDGRRQQGASTLSMQLARSLWLDPGKRWTRKFQEFLITLHLEHKLTKEQIFEYYANEIYLGRRGSFNIHGFGEAARSFFGKDLAQISTAEAATLAGMIQRPSYYNPVRFPERARDRRNLVLGLMIENGYLTRDAHRQALESPVRTAAAEVDPTSAPYFTALVEDELQSRLAGDRNRIRTVATTLDADLQAAAEEAVRIGMHGIDRQLRGRRDAEPGQPQVALIAIDPRTGHIKALVGGRDYGASQLNHAIAMRQPGSAFKPFVYTAAIATAIDGGNKILTPATTVEDAATTFYFEKQVYKPGNFHDNYMGTVTLRCAMAHSLNNATVRVAEMVGYDKVVAIARRAGLNHKIMATPSMALGAYEATPLEVAGAYTIFANQGRRLTPTAISAVSARDGALVYRHAPDPRPALDPRAAYVMVTMLQEVLRSGTGTGVRARGFNLPAGGKTGTSRDGWFAGFTTELICVVWVGYDDNRELNLEGSRSALPIWAEFMKRAARIRPYANAKEFPVPQGIVTAQVCPISGLRAGAACPAPHSERFIAGSEPRGQCAVHTFRHDDPYEPIQRFRTTTTEPDSSEPEEPLVTPEPSKRPVEPPQQPVYEPEQ